MGQYLIKFPHMKDKIGIAMLIARFFPVQGGAEVQCKLLSNELKQKKCDVFILTQSLPGLMPVETIDSLSVVRKGFSLSGLIGSLSYLLSGLYYLAENKNKYDIIHAHLAPTPAVLAGMASKILHKPSVLLIGGSRKTGDIARANETFYGRLKLFIIKHTVDVFVCLSYEIKKELFDAGFDLSKTVILPNGVNISKFKPAEEDEKRKIRVKLGLPVDSKIVLFTGRLEPGKGLDILMEAWKSMENENYAKHLSLVINGSGSLEKRLKNRYAKCANVIYTGWTEDAASYMRCSDIFVLPSLGEGMPNSLIEAMACGLCCVSTNIGGVVDLINHAVNGMLVRPGNAKELAQAIKGLCLNNEISAELGVKAREFVESKLSIEKIAYQYTELYKTLLSRKKVPS